MTDELDETGLTDEELARQRAEELPDREVMTTIQPWPPLPAVAPEPLPYESLPPTQE
jgi:hypothetical protein